jgi:two-component system nitrate/nitrite response regulator NarL
MAEPKGCAEWGNFHTLLFEAISSLRRTIMSRDDPKVGELTNRERQIIHLVSEGLSNKQIARRLNISDGTIKVHLHNIFEKLQVSNRTALTAGYLSRSRYKLE